MLPNLDVVECVVVGDVIMLPSKIILDKPKEKPKSAAIDFWNRWYDGKQTVFDMDAATLNLIKQSRIRQLINKLWIIRSYPLNTSRKYFL